MSSLPLKSPRKNEGLLIDQFSFALLPLILIFSSQQTIAHDIISLIK